jgi:hypothetical protein
MASGRTIVTRALSHPCACAQFAFASLLCLPLPYTPWLLLREEGHNTTPRFSLCALTLSLLAFQRSCRAFLLPPSFRSFHTHTCGYFSTFARATCSLSVSDQYLGLEFNAPMFARRTKAVLLSYKEYPSHFAYEVVTLFGRSFQSVRLMRLVSPCTTSPAFCKAGFGLPYATFTRRY